MRARKERGQEEMSKQAACSCFGGGLNLGLARLDAYGVVARPCSVMVAALSVAPVMRIA